MSERVLPSYKGVPLDELQINSIRWSEEDAKHIRTRTDRNGPNDMSIEPEWATEAALDADRLVALAAANLPDTASLKVVGYSPSAKEFLKVWIWTDEPELDTWNGGSACRASTVDRKRYLEVDHG